MPDARSAANRVNTRNLRETRGGRAKRRATLRDTVKKREITADCGADPSTGTALANLQIPIGCAPSPASAPLYRHGGARNIASRNSDYLTPKKAQQLIKAAQRANHIGRPLNRHITIHWQSAGLSDREAMQATTAFLKYLREWLRGDTAYLWVRENGMGERFARPHPGTHSKRKGDEGFAIKALDQALLG